MLGVIKIWPSVILNHGTDKLTIIAFDDCWEQVTLWDALQSLDQTNNINQISNPRIAAALKIALRDIATALSTRTEFPRNTCCSSEILQK